MDLPFELFIALRYLLAPRKQAFISVISLISVLGVMVGVMALLISLALMTGLQGELRDRIVGSAAHVYVQKVGGITDPEAEVRKMLTVPRVLGAAPIVQGKALLTSDGGGQAFIEVKGVVPAQEKTVTRIQEAMLTGSVEALETAPGTTPAILVGKDLADKLQVRVGDRVQISSPPKATLTPIGAAESPAAVQGRGHVQPGAVRVRLGLRVRPHRRRAAGARQGHAGLHRAARRRHVRGAGNRRLRSPSGWGPTTWRRTGPI